MFLGSYLARTNETNNLTCIYFTNNLFVTSSSLQYCLVRIVLLAY